MCSDGMRAAPRYIGVQGCRVCATIWGASNRRWGDSDRWTRSKGSGPGGIYRYDNIVVIWVFVITQFLPSLRHVFLVVSTKSWWGPCSPRPLKLRGNTFFLMACVWKSTEGWAPWMPWKKIIARSAISGGMSFQWHQFIEYHLHRKMNTFSTWF